MSNLQNNLENTLTYKPQIPFHKMIPENKTQEESPLELGEIDFKDNADINDFNYHLALLTHQIEHLSPRVLIHEILAVLKESFFDSLTVNDIKDEQKKNLQKYQDLIHLKIQAKN